MKYYQNFFNNNNNNKMPANSLLKNKYFDKLSLNRLKVNSLKVNKLFEKKHDCSCKSVSYLFSLVLQKASWNSETNELTFSKSDALSLLRFTDRPYQYDTMYKDYDAVKYLDILFISNPNGINSFEKDPPNGVLVAPEGQQAYNIKLQSVDDDGNVKLVLDLFRDTDGNYVSQLESFTDQKVSLFIDSIDSTQSKCPTAATGKCKFKTNYGYKVIGLIYIDSFSKYACHGDENNATIFSWGGKDLKLYKAKHCNY